MTEMKARFYLQIETLSGRKTDFDRSLSETHY